MTAVTAQSLSVHTSDGSVLLSDISVEIDEGETVIVSGPPGSGKTLFAKAIRGLLANRSDLTVSGQVDVPGTIGFVLQRPQTQLVRQTVYRDIAFGLENQGTPVSEIHTRVARAADRFDATHLLDRSVQSLSGGEATIVALLGVFVTEPAVVILDEPLSSLDYPNTTLVLDAIDRLRCIDTTILVLEHDVRELLQRCDRCILLENGSIATTGGPRDVLAAFFAAGVKLPFHTEVVLASEIEYAVSELPLAPFSRSDRA